MPVYRPVYPVAPVKEIDVRAELVIAIDELPPLPRILDRVLHMLDDSTSSCAQVAALIEKDTVLSGNVLRCVNSAYYGLPGTVSSIRHAVSLLGLSTIRNQALAFSLRRMLQGARTPPARLYGRYAQHSLACGVLCHYLAVQNKVENCDAAFACGLFHDVGKLLILSSFPERLPRIIERYEQGDGDWEVAEQETVGVRHSQVSAMVLEKWKLPLFMRRAVQFHHRPMEAGKSSSALSLATVLHAADLYVNQMGLETLPTKQADVPLAEEVWQKLGLHENMSAVVDRFLSEYQSMQVLF